VEYRNLKESIVRQISCTRAYLPLRAAYQTVFNRESIRLRLAKRQFFRPLVEPGALVFDIGANVGEYADLFLRLGARVVAVEPNPACCVRVRALGRRRRLTVRCEAVSDKQGEATLFLGAHSGHSTLSEEWMKTAQRTDPGFQWNEGIRTRLNTLDQLQLEYGTPDFVKIDVEGHEHCVLKGMSFKPSALSFEFHAFARDQLNTCLQLPIFGPDCRFNIVLSDCPDFVWHGWNEKHVVIDYISSLPSDVFGDIYVKLRSV
jgi:FkbM family methyltransferase